MVTLPSHTCMTEITLVVLSVLALRVKRTKFKVECYKKKLFYGSLKYNFGNMILLFREGYMPVINLYGVFYLWESGKSVLVSINTL